MADEKQADKKDEQKETATKQKPEEQESPKEQKTGSDDTQPKEVPAKFKSLVEEIEKLSVVELSELVQTLEDRFGVSAAVPMAAAPAAAGGGESGEAAADEGKSEFTIVLKEAGDKKIDVIKAVREISGLGLAESKAVVDGAPKTVKENVPKDEAEAAKKKLEDAGAKAELE